MKVKKNSSEIKRDIGRKSGFFHIPLYSMPPSEYCHPVWYEKTIWWSYPTVKKNFEDMFRHNTGV